MNAEGPQYGLEAKLDTGEWKFVDEDWSEWTSRERMGHWLRTWNGVKQVLRWLPASNQESQPADYVPAKSPTDPDTGLPISGWGIDHDRSHPPDQPPRVLPSRGANEEGTDGA